MVGKEKKNPKKAKYNKALQEINALTSIDDIKGYLKKIIVNVKL